MNDKNKQLAPFHDFHDFFAGNKKETGRKQEKKKKNSVERTKKSWKIGIAGEEEEGIHNLPPCDPRPYMGTPQRERERISHILEGGGRWGGGSKIF